MKARQARVPLARRHLAFMRSGAARQRGVTIKSGCFPFGKAPAFFCDTLCYELPQYREKLPVCGKEPLKEKAGAKPQRGIS